MEFKEIIQDAWIYGVFPAVLGALFAAPNGSLAATKRHWHREDIYSACIRPNRNRVKDLSMLLGAAIALAAYVGMATANLLPHKMMVFAITLAVAAVSTFYITRARGRRIYGESVRQAGYPE